MRISDWSSDVCSSDLKSTSTLPPADAYAQLTDSKGADRGRADIYRDGSGLRIELVARGFGPGTYGMHVHSVGQCTPPDFASAGPHWHPTGAQHGRQNPHGDRKNAVEGKRGVGRVKHG